MRLTLLPIIVTLTLVSQSYALDLTVEQCEELGLSNNHTLKAHQATVEGATQDTKISRSAFLPTLEAQGTYTVLDQPERVVIDKDVFGGNSPPSKTEISDDDKLYGVGLTLRQNVYTGGRLTHAYQRDRELLSSTRHQLVDFEIQLAYDLKKTFYQILIYQQYVESYTQQVNAHREGLQFAMTLAEEGQLMHQRVDQARAKLMFSEARLLEMQQKVSNALDHMHRLLGMEGYEEITLVDTVTYPRLNNSTPDLTDIAINHREDLKHLDAQIKATEENFMLAKSRYLPEVYALGGYIRRNESNLTREDNWGVSINFDWKLYEGGKTDAEIAKAKAEKQRWTNLRHDLAVTIRNEVQAVERQVQQKQLLVDAYKVNLQAEEGTYRTILKRREQGEVLAVDLAEQKATLHMAHAEYMESINQLRIAVAALEAAMATPVMSLLEKKDIYSPSLFSSKSLSQSLPTGNKRPAGSQVKESALQPSRSLASVSTMPGHEYGYVVQLGAFKSKKWAYAFMENLRSQYPLRNFETIAVDGFHKVRSTPSQSYSAALKTLKDFKEQGFIVRTSANQ